MGVSLRSSTAHRHHHCLSIVPTKRINKFMLFKQTVKSRFSGAVIKIAAFAPN